MKSVSVRGLKESASELLQAVQETKEEITIVRNHKPVARIVPSRRPMTAAEIADWNARMNALAKKIGELWTGPLDASEVMAAERER